MDAGADAPFGVRLRRLRQAAGLTQEELAERAELSPSAIGMLERGDRRRAYPHTVRSLAHALGLSPEQRAELLAATRSLAGGPIPPPPMAGTALSAPPTALLGRDREVEAVARLIRDADVRLVTLIGPGGVGKTRLAVELPSHVADAFAHGVFLVPLASIRDPELVIPTVAHAIGLGESGERSLSEVLHAYLRDKHVLLLLDNFEHLLDAAGALADLLAASPRLTVLATSRAPLRIRGEREYAVEPLPVPDPDRVASPAQLGEVPAVELFVERAQAASPAFALTDANAVAVAAICRRLDGLPLALELAAVWLRMLGPAQLLERLDRALPLLTGGARDLPERQKTMRAAIQWSFDLLAPPEQALFRRLSVFAEGWTLEAAEAICGLDDLPPERVLDVLSVLVEQSLVVAEIGPLGETRYRMLEPVRQYARELLGASGEAERVGRAHADFFLRFAERAQPEINGHRQVEWLDRLEVDYDNVRQAIGWSEEASEPPSVVRFGRALCMFWVIHDRHDEGRRWMERVLGQGQDLPAKARADALYAQAVCEYGLGDPVRVLALSEESAALYRQIEDRYGDAISMGLVGFARTLLGDLDRADEAFQESLEILRELGDRWASAHLWSHWAAVPLMRGDYRQAAHYAEEALEHTRATGDRLGACAAHLILGRVAAELGDHQEAARSFKSALIHAAEMRDRANAAHCIRGLAEVFLVRERAEGAARLLGAADRLLEMTGAPQYAYAPGAELQQRVEEMARAQLGDQAWVVAWRKGRAMTLDESVGFALSSPASESG